LLDWLTVKENLFLGKRIRHLPPSPDDEQIIHRLELAPLLRRYPRQLSGGQQQRVALARAWALQPDLLLMDEPFSSLDTHTAERSLDLFLQLWETRKPTTLFVTHNLREAMRVGQSIVTLSEQPAEVLEVFSEQDFYRLC
jgi:NitT/TauT family transport system ATP-binding protein